MATHDPNVSSGASPTLAEDDIATLLGEDTDDDIALEEEEEAQSPLLKPLALLARGDGGWWTLSVFIIICIAFGIAAPDFFSKANWIATSEYAVEYIMLAIGETFVIATGGIDLSVGAILSFSAMLGSVVMQNMLGAHDSMLLTTVIGILIGVGSGTAIGAINGLLITRL